MILDLFKKFKSFQKIIFGLFIVFPSGIQNNVRNLFRVNNKDTRTTSLISFWCPYC